MAGQYLFLETGNGTGPKGGAIWDATAHSFPATNLTPGNTSNSSGTVNFSGDGSTFVFRGTQGASVVNTTSFIATAVPNTNTATFRTGVTTSKVGIALSPDASLLYMTGQADGKLYVLNTTTGATVATSPTAVVNTTLADGALVVSPDGGTILIPGGLIPNTDNNSYLYAYRLSDFARLWVTSFAVTGRVGGYDATNGFIYILSGAVPNRLLKINAATGVEVSHVDMVFSAGSAAFLAIDSTATNMYVVSNTGRYVNVVYLPTMVVVDNFDMGAYPATNFNGIILTSDDTKLYRVGGSFTATGGYLGEWVIASRTITDFQNLNTSYFIASSSRSLGIVPPPPNPQPNPPANVGWMGCQGPRNTIFWTDSNAASYRITRDGALIGTSPTTSFIDTTARQGVQYTYTVYGVSLSGVFSVPVNITVTTCAGQGSDTRVDPGPSVTSRTCPGAPVTTRICP